MSKKTTDYETKLARVKEDIRIEDRIENKYIC